jgi:hypothetical protein
MIEVEAALHKINTIISSEIRTKLLISDTYDPNII